MADEDNINDLYEDGEEDNSPQEKPPATVADQVNTLLGSMVQNEKGDWELPEEAIKDIPEAVIYAAKAERRYRDTQSSYTKSRQELKALKTTNESLVNHMIENATLDLTQEQRDQLDELRGTDPEAWRDKLTEYETAAKDAQRTKTKEFEDKGKKVSEAEMRQAMYADFTERTGIELSDQVIENQLPASYSKNMSDGTWTFEEFLANVETFLSKDKVIKDADDKGDKPTQMGKLPGGKDPDEAAKALDDVEAYDKETY